MIGRELSRQVEAHLMTLMREFPVVAIVGPRQCGKSTLAHRILPRLASSVYLDLELPSDIIKLHDPEAYLGLHQTATVCLDEIQRYPNLFPVLRALVDRQRAPGRFLILGSASPQLLHQSTESLAGRIAYLELTPFTVEELPPGDDPNRHWLRGGFPDSYLAGDDAASYRWREQFVRTFLDRDIPALGIDVTRPAVERLWTMLAAATATVLNRAKFADPVGVSPQTISRYIDLLESTLMVRSLRPYFHNTKKRMVRSPKIYLRDSGLLHTLLGIRSWDDLYGNPIIGASWEAYAIEQIVSAVPGWRASFYRTSAGAEIDLVLQRADRMVAVECKSTRTPRVTQGFYQACEDIGATERYIVAPLATSELIPFGKNTWLCRPEDLIGRLG